MPHDPNMQRDRKLQSPRLRRSWRVSRLLVALLIAQGFLQEARAQTVDADTLAAATELYELVSGDSTTQTLLQVTNALWPNVEKQLRAGMIDDATIADLRVEFDRLILTKVNVAIKAAPPIYAKYFSAEEIRQMTEFYRSPVGTKAIRQNAEPHGRGWNHHGVDDAGDAGRHNRHDAVGASETWLWQDGSPAIARSNLTAAGRG